MMASAAEPAIGDRRTSRREVFAVGSITSWMVAAIVLVIGLAWLDSVQEGESALDDYAREQRSTARAVAGALSLAAEQVRATGARFDATAATAYLHELQDDGSERLLWAADSGATLVDARGQTLDVPDIPRAIHAGLGSVRIAREHAPRVGLPERAAVAGIAKVSGVPHAYAVTVASAAHLRDRQRHARIRLLLTVGFGTAVVFAFGRVALARHRKELELVRELAAKEQARAGDERLVREGKLATLGALATGVAHEVSTPLAVIMGRAEQLLPKLEHDAKAQRAARVILEQADRIRAVMQGLLGLARGQAPRLERVQASSLVESATALVAHRFERQRAVLDVRVPDPAPVIACDARLFEHALVNLLLNACDASPPGGRVELCVGVRGDRVTFDVRDEGHGISDDAMARATEPFFTTKAVGEGTGLGLAIVHEIVKHHQGELVLARRSAVEGRGARGTRVTIDVPLVREEAHA